MLTPAVAEPLIFVDAAEVRRLLPMADCIDAMAGAMRAVSAGTIALPPRVIAPLVDGSGGLCVMPGSSLEPPTYGAKVLSLHPDNPKRDLPTIQGFVALFDHHTGTPVAIVDGAEITAIRTAATSGLATRELARQDASTLGLFGYGVQASTHLEAVLAVREIASVRIWGRSLAKAEAFARAQSQRHGLPVQATASAEEAASCDVVCTVSAAPEPVLEGRWLRPGAHLNLVGAHTPKSREVDGEAIARSAVYVDLLESARNEAGDVLMAIEEGAVGEDPIVGELGQLLAGACEGRTDARQITLYKSVGLVAQDLVAAHLVYRRAFDEGR